MASPRTPTPAGAAARAAAAAGRRLTSLDVARALGVSRTTVSNAFNRPQQLSTDLREEVIRRSRELGYFGPDPAARAMRRTGLEEVAVVFHHDLRYALSDPPSLEFLRGVTKELDARRLSLQLIPKMGRRVELGAAFQTTAGAIIVHAEIDPDLADQVRAIHKPIVLVDAFVSGVASVSHRDRHGAELAMAHALAARPDRVIVLGFPLNDTARARVLQRLRPPQSGYISGERMAGYVAAARRVGFSLQHIDWLDVDDRDPESAAAIVAAHRGHIAAHQRVALVAMSDRMALAALPVLRSWRGVDVAAIVGFDDIEAAQAAQLTTVHQNAQLKGERAVQALLDGSKPKPLPVQLVVRDT
jgi:DNA-binding LacI/PurR family transcriptional regulator